jgi:transcriptional regulator with XRE-family HTH domain
VNIGERLRQIRQIHNISAKKLARELEVDPSTISKIENNQALPSIELLLKICEYFKITPADFFDNVSRETTPEIQELVLLAKKLPQEDLKLLQQIAKRLNK